MLSDAAALMATPDDRQDAEEGPARGVVGSAPGQIGWQLSAMASEPI
jgi:hypothetical protein